MVKVFKAPPKKTSRLSVSISNNDVRLNVRNRIVNKTIDGAKRFCAYCVITMSGNVTRRRRTPSALASNYDSGEINREVDRLVDAIANGHRAPAVLGPRSSQLDEQRRKITED
jgi:hypothetical protein